MLNKKSGMGFGCFSPPVMIATFAIEIIFAIYTLAKHHDKLWGKIIALILLCLATFQLAEFQVCGGTNQLFWARVGYVAITLLPPLGITLAHIIAKKPLNTLLHKVSWLLAIICVAIFAFAPVTGTFPVCNGNYVIFRYEYLAIGKYLYTAYYFGLLFAAMFASYKWTKDASKNVQKAARGLIAGYSLFILPTLAANLADQATVAAIPSIMCGFAVLWAIVLTLHIRPTLAKTHK